MACAGGVRYEVKAQRPVLVQPSSKTESHAPYFLTNLDQALTARAVEAIIVFGAKNAEITLRRDGVDPVKLLKESLRKVLVHFYPLAGRLRLSSDDGNLFIECNGQGVSFVEADANVNISDFGNFWQPDAATLGPLVFPLPAMDDPPLLSAQVTRFKCGGFVLGFVFQHSLFDGVGAVEFMSAWGEIARGVPLSTLPVLDRTSLKSRSPLQISYPHVEYLDIEDAAATQNTSDDALVRSFCFTSASLGILSRKVMEDGVLSKCTVFEALSGLIWRARTRALWGEFPEQKVKLMIAVDGRPNLKPALPRGYVGNGLVFAGAVASARELQENPLSHAVKRVQDAIAQAATDEYMRSQLDYMEFHKLRVPPFGATFGITTWSKLSFHTIDFGWGKPTYVGPVTLILAMEAAIFFSYGGHDANGINVVVALPPKAMNQFEEILQPHLNPLFLSPRL